MSRRLGFWLALAIGGLGLGGCATTTTVTEVQRLQARAAFERGVKHFEDKEAAAALSALKEAISIDGTVPVYRDVLGLALLELHRPELAREEFQRAIELDPNYADAHFHLGTALAEVGRWEEAIVAYRRALGLPALTVPHFAYQNLGLALYHLKRYRDAEEALRFALNLEPKLTLAYYNLGLVYLAEGRREEAKAVFRRTRELSPDSPAADAAGERLRALGEDGK